MGHYCRICGRTRANEKFSGKGHKNHICKDCTCKSGSKSKKNVLNESVIIIQYQSELNDELIQLKEEYFDDEWILDVDCVYQHEDDEELTF